MLLVRFSETKTLKVWPGSANTNLSWPSHAVGKGALLTAFNKETDGFSICVISRTSACSKLFLGLALCLSSEDKPFFSSVGPPDIIINQSIIVKNAWQLVAARCNSQQFCRANAFNCVTESRRRATRQTCGIDSGFGFNIYDYQTSYWQYNALISAVSNDNLWFFEKYLEGLASFFLVSDSQCRNDHHSAKEALIVLLKTSFKNGNQSQPSNPAIACIMRGNPH